MPDEGPQDLPEVERPAAPMPLGERLREAIELRGWTVGRVVGGGLALVVALAVGWWVTRPPAPPIEAALPVETTTVAAAGPGSTSASTGSTEPQELIVHAAGAVVRPGVYRLPAGARVADVIDAAGGLSPDADGDRVNLAAPVADGERVYVLRRGETSVPSAPVGPSPTTGPPGSDDGEAPAALVDLNTATAEQLDTLPGVGPATAEAIIAYRTEQGPFTSVDELLEVRGIGDAKLADLRDRVTV